MDFDAATSKALTARAIKARNAMFAAHALQHMFTLSLPPLLLFIHLDLQISWTQLGVLLAVASVTGGLAQFPSGLLVDRFGVKRVLAAGFLFTLSGLFFFSRSSTLIMFIVAQVISGLGNSTFHPASFAETSRAARRMGRLSMGLALHSIGGNIGTASAYSVAAILATWLGWRSALQVLVGLGAMLATWFVISYREMPDLEEPPEAPRVASSEGDLAQEDGPAGTHAPGRWVPVIIIATAAFLSGAFGSGFSSFLPTLLASIRGATPAVAGMLSTLMLLSGAGGSLVGGQVGDRYDRTVIIVISSVSTVSLIAVLLGVHLHVLPLIALLIGIGFFQSLSRPCLNALTASAAPVGKAGSVFGLVFGVMSIGGALSAPLVGYMADLYSLEMGIRVISGFLLCFGFLIFGFRKAIHARSRY